MAFKLLGFQNLISLFDLIFIENVEQAQQLYVALLTPIWIDNKAITSAKWEKNLAIDKELYICYGFKIN